MVEGEISGDRAASGTARPLRERLAGAPISWGVCEVPGWGVELPPARVLAEMRALGLRATEFGPVGYLGTDAEEVAALLADAGLTLVGGFVPVVLHDPAARDESLSLAERTAALYAACGGTMLVSAAVEDAAWSRPRGLEGARLRHLVEAREAVDELAEAHGLRHVLHPHAGTLVERADEIRRVLDASDVALCLDTGHLAIGGADPAALASEHPERIGHVHLKDVREAVAARLRAGELTIVEAVRAGLFRPLGDGDVPLGETLDALDRAGYDGWLVLEQDVALPEAPPEGAGPVEDVRRSIEFLLAREEVART